MNAFDRNTNLIIIQELRNSEKRTLDDYIDKVLIPLGEQNPTFSEILYKDIVYVMEGLDKDEDNDLMIENGDFIIKDSDYMLTGHQTRLHDIVIWLHIEAIKKIESQSKHPNDFLDRIEKFNTDFLRDFNFILEYKIELDKIKASLKKERKHNYENRKGGLSKYFDPNILELKPNIMGLGININEIINKFNKK